MLDPKSAFNSGENQMTGTTQRPKYGDSFWFQIGVNVILVFTNVNQTNIVKQ